MELELGMKMGWDEDGMVMEMGMRMSMEMGIGMEWDGMKMRMEMGWV